MSTDVDLDFGDLRAAFVNCTLKRSPETSNTDALMDNAAAIMAAHGVEVDRIRATDHVIPPGVQEDMTAFGEERDDWPALQARVLAADILVLGTPIWLGAKSSVCTRVVERLYGYSGELNDQGQWTSYGRAGGIPAHGNQRAAWDAGARFDHPNPEYR